MDIIEVIKTLGSTASIISAYLTARKYVKDHKTPGQLDAQQIEKAEYNPDKYFTHEIKMALKVIPGEILDAYGRRIQKAKQRFIKALNSPISIMEIDKEEEIVSFEICHLLKMIMKHNGGELPDGELVNLWESFRCEIRDDDSIH